MFKSRILAFFVCGGVVTAAAVIAIPKVVTRPDVETVFNPWNGYQPPWGEAQKTAFNPWGSYMPPWENLQTVNRDNKGDREPAAFADRFDAVKDLDPKSMPALHKWMVEHGIVGGAVVAAEDE